MIPNYGPLGILHRVPNDGLVRLDRQRPYALFSHLWVRLDYSTTITIPACLAT
jgi:hypothetical protein